MNRAVGGRAVVLDIEGTVSPIAVVQQQLFPYARARLAAWVVRTDPEVQAVVNEIRAVLGEPAASPDTVAAQLAAWSDADVKAGPLKTLQGLIWRDGFETGQLRAVLYPDVLSALDRWGTDGIDVYVYSSGSELAQRLWFAHTQFGDLSDRIRGHFDTRSAGPKREPHSYRTIATSIGVPPPDILFMSDSLGELDAARSAGWATLGVSRPEDGPPDLTGHPSVTSLGALPPGVVSESAVSTFVDANRRPEGVPKDQPVVLFLCIHNSGRSAAARVLLAHHAHGTVEVLSAGSEPGDQINPAIAQILTERGLDPSKEFPKPITDEIARAADVIVTMGCGDACPVFPGKRYLDWELTDPAGLPVEQVRPIVDDIEQRVQALLAELVAAAT